MSSNAISLLAALAALFTSAPGQNVMLVTWREHVLAEHNLAESSGSANSSALMQTADTVRSDLDLAGMMVRCHDRRLEPMLIILDPLPPRTRVGVVVSAAGQAETLDATLIPTGAGIVVPLDLEARLRGAWADEPDIVVTIQTPRKTIKGVVPLNGLKAILPPYSDRCRTSDPVQ